LRRRGARRGGLGFSFRFEPANNFPFHGILLE
jgi:hypothetical protein